MKITIRYQYDPAYGSEMNHWATDGTTWRGGRSFTEARQRLVACREQDLRELVPPDEEIEI